MKVLLATPARALDCNDDVFIFSNDLSLNNSPNPSIILSRSGSMASGVPSDPVIPVPPLKMIASIYLFKIKSEATFLIA